MGGGEGFHRAGVSGPIEEDKRYKTVDGEKLEVNGQDSEAEDEEEMGKRNVEKKLDPMTRACRRGRSTR